MNWQQIYRRRLPLYSLWGDWEGVALTTPEGYQQNAKFIATIELHALRLSASHGLHTVYISNIDEEEVDVDSWSADLDIDEQGQMVTSPFWDIELLFEHKGQYPLEIVARSDEDTLILTVWHAWDKITPRQFRLLRINAD